MRKNLTVFGMLLCLLFIGLTAMVHYYPNNFTLDLLGYLTVTNTKAIYIGSLGALVFALVAFVGALTGKPGAYADDDVGEVFSAGCGCSSGFFHDDNSGIMVCLNCGTGLERDFVACPTCGQEVYQDCPECKEVVPTWYNVCPYCGYDLVVFEIAALPEEPAAPADE